MGYKFEIITQEQAEKIAFNWHYDVEYSFYDNFVGTKDNDIISICILLKVSTSSKWSVNCYTFWGMCYS